MIYMHIMPILNKKIEFYKILFFSIFSAQAVINPFYHAVIDLFYAIIT